MYESQAQLWISPSEHTSFPLFFLLTDLSWFIFASVLEQSSHSVSLKLISLSIPASQIMKRLALIL
jgi:hypothetical protein